MRVHQWFLVGLLGLGLGGAFTVEPALAQSRIGVASAAKNKVEGTIGGRTRALSTGSEIHAAERVRTGEASTAQLLFLDQTSLSVGPQSEVTLDRFVYDPNRRAGNVVINATRGAFRFVSGSQTPSNYQIKTPVATIGVRGTIVDFFSSANRLILVLVECCAQFTYQGQLIEMNVPGQAWIITPNGLQGPITWDSTLINVTAGMPFPLFGNTFLSDPKRIETGDPKIDLTNQLESMGSPPVSQPCYECECYSCEFSRAGRRK